MCIILSVNMLKRSLIVPVICCMPGLLSAGVIYSNMGAGFPGDSPAFFASTTLFFGTTFTTSGGGSLLNVSTDLSASQTSPIVAALYTNSSGQPGTLLESWSIMVPIIVKPPPIPPLTTFASVLNPLLSSGTQYWFVMTTATNNTIYWAENDTAVNGGVWGGTSLTTLGQVSSGLPTPGIQLNATPEPVSGWLLASGTLVLMVLRRLSKSAHAK
jgi:hypothetical protein